MRFAFAAALLFVVLAAACSDREDPTPSAALTPTPVATPTPLPAGSDVLAAVRDALQVVAGYRVQVTASNFPLEGWGGIDSGFVTVGRGGATGFADLVRTGDGGYSMIVDHDQLYFRRDTCETWKHLPGVAAAGVLLPFAFNANDTFATATATKVEAGKREKQVILTMRTQSLGVVQVTVNTETSLPARIFRDPATGQEPLELLFSEWGKGPTFRTPADAQDAMPGPSLKC